ncbi:hypothetical protein [Halorussus sp. MSC15.2]|uniref:hypothetical protein n=1 Tax=Halorussus sp. MSC15.2 TaxID=2283638 RepID=UPI0013D76C6C|nr:hypothetical protein [Halorussus sp. MSC15.2]NEU57445.1 hypothetical protein [Halorussus sp. MSC15.2]
MPQESNTGRTAYRLLTTGERHWEFLGLLTLVTATIAYTIGSVAAGESVGAQAPLAVVVAGLTATAAVLVKDFEDTS